MPGGVTASSSFYRIERARAMSGVPIEYFGVEPHIRYYPRRRDRVEKQADLIEFLGEKLLDWHGRFKN